MKFFTRFLLILIIFALLPVLAMSIWLLRSNISARENVAQLHPQVAHLFSDFVEHTVGELNRSLGFVEDLERLDTEDSIQSFKIIQRAMASQRFFTLLSIVDASGMETTRMADSKLFPLEGYVDRKQDPLVRQAVETGRVAVGSVELRENRPLLTMAYPLPRDRCLYIQASLQNLWKRVREQRLGRSGRIVLLDSLGRPLAGFAEDLLPRDWDGKAVLTSQAGWFDHLRTMGGVMVGAYDQTPSLGWWVMTLQPREEAFTPAESLAARVIVFMAVLMGLAGAAAFWISWHLSRPLQALVEGAQRASRGEFGRPVPDGGWAELRMLTNNFNEMMMVLQSYKEMNLESILEEKAKVEALVHTIPDGIVLSNFDGNILYMNATARLLLEAQATSATPKNQSIHGVFQEPKLREMAVSLMKHHKRSDQSEVELKNVRGASQGIYLCRGAAVIRGKREVGILFILRDITTEKNLEHMKEEFFHSIVHDLRNPLASIDGFIQLITERAAVMTEKNLHVYMGYIQESLNNLRQLVSDILDSAKIESGTMELKIEPLDILKMAEHLKALFIIQGQRRGIEVHFEGVRDVSPLLHCDGALIQRVIMNLIGNALKFTPRGGHIYLSIVPMTNGEVEFAIKDTGVGIPEDKLEVVFEKFKQLDSGIAQRSGYGLGLSICKKIVEMHGGRIWAESQTGQGSRFVFRLPIERASLRAA